MLYPICFFFFQAEDGIRDIGVTGVQTWLFRSRFVVETIERAGAGASPPLTVGVGIGGPFERAALLAKKALTRPTGEPNPDRQLAQLEAGLLDAINATGIGPAGYGGRVTALAVHIGSFPTHIAALPVAVNRACRSPRVSSVEL